MLYRVTVTLLFALITWELGLLSRNALRGVPERRLAVEPLIQAVPICQRVSSPMSVPVAPTSETPVSESDASSCPAMPDAGPETKAQPREFRSVYLENKLRDSMFHQQAVPIPQVMDRLVDLAGREYSQVSVVRLEPDGIHIRYASGVAKLDFTQLTRDLKTRFHIEDELAVRYREALETSQREEQLHWRKAVNERIKRRREHILWNTPAASARPGEVPTSPKQDHCEMCGIQVPAARIKVYQALLSAKDKKRRSVKCCPDCVPYPVSNLADPYMPR